MEHKKKTPEQNKPQATKWLSAEEIEELRQSSKDFQKYVKTTPIYKKWQERAAKKDRQE